MERIRRDGRALEDKTLIICETENSGLDILQELISTKTELLTKNKVRQMTGVHNCGFYEETVVFTVNKLICHGIDLAGKSFSLGKVTMSFTDDRPAYETFAVLFTASNTKRCPLAA